MLRTLFKMMEKQSKKRKQENPKKGEKRKYQKKGGPRVPGRGGSHNIGSRAFLIFDGSLLSSGFYGDGDELF